MSQKLVDDARRNLKLRMKAAQQVDDDTTIVYDACNAVGQMVGNLSRSVKINIVVNWLKDQ